MQKNQLLSRVWKHNKKNMHIIDIGILKTKIKCFECSSRGSYVLGVEINSAHLYSNWKYHKSVQFASHVNFQT